MSEIALRLQDVNYSYLSDWARKEIPVLKKISLEVLEGEAFGFLGHNGSGKTTTIKCILGICKKKTGTIQIFGEDNSSHSSRRHVGYLPEQPYFYDNLSVRESLASYGELAELSGRELSLKIDDLLALFYLSEKANSKMRSLSKGLMQRVGMAQAIIADPKLLILDEPFSGLDPIGRKEFRDIILKLKGQGTSIFMSSHILSDVETICDRASIMVRGEIKGIYDLKALPEDLERSFDISICLTDSIETITHSIKAIAPSCIIAVQNNYVRMTSQSYSEAEKCLQFLLKEKIPIHSFEPSGSTLEEIFVKLVEDARK